MYVKTKNTAKNYLSIFFLIIFIQLLQDYSYAQTKTIYTPEGYPVAAYIIEIEDDFTPSQKAAMNTEANSLWIEPYQLNAVLIDDPSKRYTCHSYAWYISEGSLDTVDLADDKFWNDGNISNDGLPSYVPAGWESGPEEDATHSIDEYHSVRKIQNSYPRAIEGGRDYVSKWGWYGLYQHAKNHEPYYLGQDGIHRFKKLKTTHYGTLTNYPKSWVGAGEITHTVTGNTTINTTLSILRGAIVNFQNGVTLTVNGTLNINSNLTIPTGVTVIVNAGAVLNFAGGALLIVNGTLNAQGTSTNHLSFDFVSPNSSTQNGIIVNQGGTASISYATISNAYNGIKIIPNSYQSTIQNCNVQDCYDGISVQYGSKDADLTISGNTIQNNTHYGISITNSGYGMNSEPTISNNTITGCAGHGIYIYDVGYLSSISGNTVNNNSNAAGMAMYYSSPQITGNEINNNYTGIGCASVSSPDIDNNDIQGNYRGVYSISSYPFLGQEIPSIDGGNNTITGNTFRDLQAESNSIIMAEHNWWGVDPPDAGKIVALTGSSIDYNPWLPDPPGSRLAANNNLPGININNSTLQLSVKSNNNKFNYSSTVSDQAQDNFDPNWDLMRKLIYAKSLIKNKFYNTSQKILKDIINTYPDSSLSSYAINLLWNSYRNNEVDSLKSFLYSLSNKNQDIEVYGVAKIILAQYDKGNTPKALDKIMKKYSSKNIKQTALFGKFLYYINVANDKDMARSVLAEIDNQYPGSYISEDAHLQLGDGLNSTNKLGSKNIEEPKTNDNLPKEYLLSDNYPNPFSAKG